MLKNFTDLDAWQESHKLVLKIYDICKNFPSNEKFTLESQMKRAAISITSNLAEGFDRYYYGDKHRFYLYASASVSELKKSYNYC